MVIIAILTGSRAPVVGSVGTKSSTEAKAKQIVPNTKGLLSIRQIIKTSAAIVAKTNPRVT